MAEHVTSIRVNTEVDASDLEEVQKNLDKIEKKVESVSAKTNSAKKKTGLKWTEEEKREAEAQIDAILEKKKKLDESPKVQDESWDRGNTDFDWNKQAEDMAAVNEQLSKIQAEMSKNGSEAQRMSEHYNLLRTDVEAYAEELKGLEAQGKYFGDADYDKVYIAWKNAKDAVMEYAAELNKQTASGQAQEAAKVAKEQEKQAAAQRKIEEAAERIRQKDIARFEKEAKAQEKLQAEAAEQARLNALKDNAVIADERMVFLLERQKELKSYLNDLEKAGVTAGYAEHDNATRELTQVNSLIAARKRLSETVNEQKRGFAKLAETSKKCFGTIHKGTKKSNGVLSKLKSRLNGIALSLLVFNWITKGFNAMVSAMKAGFQNLAKYSNDYNTAMSEMKSECAELKNNLAAAFEPVVTAVIPYITQMVSWLNTATESISKFLATISGKSTYTRAKKQVIDYAKSLETANDSAKGALAAFDSINALSSNDTSSNGSAGGEATGSDAFETVNLTDEDMQMLDLVKDKLSEILDILIPIGVAMAVFGVGGPLAYFAGVLITVIGLLKTILEYMDAWSNGITFDNLTGMLEGLFAVILGIYLLFGPIAAGLAAIVGGIALVVVAINDMIQNGVNMQNCITIIIGLVAVMIGIFVAFGSTTAVVVAAVIGAITLVVLAIQDMIQNGFNMQNCILLAIGVVGALIAVFMLFGSTAALIVAAVVGVIAIFAAMINIAGNGEEAIAALKSMCKNFADFFKKIFAGDIKGAMESLKAAGKDFVNVVIIAFESLVNCIIKGLNWLIDKINSISFDVPDWVPFIGGKSLSPNVPHVQEVSLPRLADGAVIQGGKPFAAILGDQKFGQTNIETPLDTMVDAFKQAISDMGVSNSTGPIYLQIDGKTFAKLATPYLKQENNRIGLSFKTT